MEIILFPMHTAARFHRPMYSLQKVDPQEFRKSVFAFK